MLGRVRARASERAILSPRGCRFRTQSLWSARTRDDVKQFLGGSLPTTGRELATRLTDTGLEPLGRRASGDQPCAVLGSQGIEQDLKEDNVEKLAQSYREQARAADVWRWAQRTGLAYRRQGPDPRTDRRKRPNPVEAGRHSVQTGEDAGQMITEVERAETCYQQALILADELGMRPLQAHCHYSLGRLYTHMGRVAPARATLSTAIGLYRDMAMTFWLPQAEAARAAME